MHYMASYVLMRINLEGQNDLGQGTKRGVLSNHLSRDLNSYPLPYQADTPTNQLPQLVIEC